MCCVFVLVFCFDLFLVQLKQLRCFFGAKFSRSQSNLASFGIVIEKHRRHFQVSGTEHPRYKTCRDTMSCSEENCYLQHLTKGCDFLDTLFLGHLIEKMPPTKVGTSTKYDNRFDCSQSRIAGSTCCRHIRLGKFHRDHGPPPIGPIGPPKGGGSKGFSGLGFLVICPDILCGECPKKTRENLKHGWFLGYTFPHYFLAPC